MRRDALKWYDAKSLPKDGTLIIAWCSELGWVELLFWHEGAWRLPGSAEDDEENVHCFGIDYEIDGWLPAPSETIGPTRDCFDNKISWWGRKALQNSAASPLGQ